MELLISWDDPPDLAVASKCGTANTTTAGVKKWYMEIIVTKDRNKSLESMINTNSNDRQNSRYRRKLAVTRSIVPSS